MAASTETITINSGRYWTPPSEKAVVTYSIEGYSVTNSLGVTTTEPDFTFIAAVNAAIDAWENVADIDFQLVSSSSAFPSDPFAIETSKIDVIFDFNYTAPSFYQTNIITTLIGASPDGGEGPQLTGATIQVDPLYYQNGNLNPGANTAFIDLLNGTGISMGLAWGRGIEDEAYSDSLTTYNNDLNQYYTIDLPIYNAELIIFNADYAVYLVAVAAYDGTGEAPTAPTAPSEPTLPEPPNEPVSDHPSSTLELDGDPMTFTRNQARLDNTIMVQQTFSGTNATLDGSAGGRPLGPQIWDIAAAQFLYGVNKQYNAGDDIYDFSSGSQYAKTLWDAGGADTISISNSTIAGVIDLREGETFVTSIAATRAWNAFGANIENAWGGSGDDTITGNSLNNMIGGAAGADVIDGGGGVDLIGFSASDAGVNVDILAGTGAGGHAQGDTYTNIDNVFGSTFNDIISGNNNNNDLRGDSGNDSITSLDGNDFINGNQGNDDVNGGNGADTVRGGKDNDTVNGDGGNDFVAGDREDDIVNGGDGDDFARGGKNNDTIDGGAGNDTLFGDLGNDSLTGGSGNDYFVFYTDSGTDIVTDFEGVGAAIGDIIRISSTVYSTVDEVLVNISGSVLDLGNNDATVTFTGVTGFTTDDIEII